MEPLNISKRGSQLHGDLKEVTQQLCWVSLPYLLAIYLFDVIDPHLIPDREKTQGKQTSQQYKKFDAGLNPFLLMQPPTQWTWNLFP